MKKYILSIMMLAGALATQAQEAPTAGFLLPRMTTAQKTAMVNPAKGLTIYNTDTNAQEINTGTAAAPVWSVVGTASSLSSKFTNDATNTRVALNNLSDGVTARPAGTEYNIYDNGTVNIGSGIGNRLNSKLQVFRNITSLPVSAGYVNTSSILKMSGGLASGRSVSSNFDLLNLGSAESNNYDGIIQASRSQILLGTDLGMNSDASGSVNNAFNGIINEAQGLNVGIINSTTGSGKITNAKGIEVNISRNGSGIIQNAYGLFIKTVSSAGTESLPHNSYGVYIDNSIASSGGTINTSYSIYSASIASSYYAGNVGIGTSNPTRLLEVSGSATPIIQVTATSGSAGYKWVTPTVNTSILASGTDNSMTFLDNNGAGGYLTLREGKMGLGISSPVERLEVNGAIKIGSTSAATPTAGTIRFNTTTSKFEGYDGTAWVVFH